MAQQPRNPLKVNRSGQLTTSREWAREQGLSPGDEVDRRDLVLRRKGHTRRAVLRYVGIGLGAGIIGFGADVFSLADHFGQRSAQQDEAIRQRLGRLVGAGETASVALMPARDHPFRPLPQEHVAYEIEGGCMTAYAERLWPGVRPRIVRGFPQTRPDDTLVLFGSQISNQRAREHFGNPFAQEPTTHATYGTSREPRRVPLRWNLSSPPGTAQVIRQQYGGDWAGGEYRLLDFAERCDVVEQAGGRDYFLVTAIPRYAEGPQRVIMFAGLHGAGTRGATDWLAAPDPVDLAAIERKSSGSPYYQALFEVPVEQRDGELVPAGVNLLDACALEA
jgi:hypothetical protein